MILTLFAKTRFLCFVLAGLFLVGVLPYAAFAQGKGKVENIRVQVAGTIAYIYYTLSGPAEQVYDVSLVLKSRSKPSFEYKPKTVSGDIGPTVFTGVDWRIAWNFGKEYPQGFNKNDNYFVVEAKALPSTEAGPSAGISPVLLVAGGAAVVGGVVALLLMKKSDTPPVTPTGFPTPPGRP